MQTISYTNKATINTGNYENLNPFYSMVLTDVKDDEVVGERLRIKELVDGWLLEDVKKFKTIIPDNHRFTVVEGVKTPHVTNIITPDTPAIPYIDEHAELGTWLDGVLKNYFLVKELKEFEFKDKGNIKTKAKDLFKQTSIWLEEHGSLIEVTNTDITCFNQEFSYIGEADLLGTYSKVSAIMDIKKTEKLKPMLDKYFMQMAAYAVCMNPIPEIMVILSPYNEPVVEGDIDKYFKKFLVSRGRYLERFGV